MFNTNEVLAQLCLLELSIVQETETACWIGSLDRMVLSLSRVWLETEQLSWDWFALVNAVLVLLAKKFRPATSNVT